MLKYKYSDRWDASLNEIKMNAKSGKTKSKKVDEESTSGSTLQNIFLSHSDKRKANQNVQFVIEKILNTYDADDCLYGLFKALSKSQPRVSPFIATHDYCVQIRSCNIDGHIEFNISPIYHLGPDYVEEYKKKHGTDLDDSAVIGLSELNVLEHGPAHKKFLLGIDAGIVFKDSKIPHNKIMQLNLQPAQDGVMANLICETQTTSKKFTWNDLEK